MTHLGKQILLLYFYPRPPRGGRLANLGEQPVKKKISIHALREEGDVGIHGVSSTSPIFLSTPSARRATVMRMIADVSTLFLSTPSARRATRSIVCMPDGAPFLSTPSARRATFYEGTPLHDGADFYPRPPRGGRRLKLSHKMRFGQ